MKFSDLDSHPEYPDKQVIEDFCILVLQESEMETVVETLDKLRLLGDKQWHTYELPSKDLQTKIRQWLINNWISNTDAYLEALLSTCINFALEKELFRKALDLYAGKHKTEFEAALNNSQGDHIDPWWTRKQ